MKIDSQIPIDFTGSQLRDIGIDMAVSHAENEIPNWKQLTWNLFLEFLKGVREPFLIESFRSWLAVNHPDYEWPPKNQAMGFIPLKAAKQNLIIKVGYGIASNAVSHCRPSTMWKKL